MGFDKDQIENFGYNFFEFLFSLEDLFCRKIDLIEREAIRNHYFKEDVNETKKLVFESLEKTFQLEEK